MFGENKNLGSYRILAFLGKGTYAEVYKAEDLRLGRLVALKVLKPVMVHDADAVARFLKEARLAGNLFHQRLAVVLDAGEENGRYYLAMRYIEGPNLAQVLAERGPLPWEEVVRLTGQIAEALAVLHRQGIVHRDLKPANVMLEGGKEVVLTDFGLARALAVSGLSTESMAFVGTPPYIPPEIWRGEQATPAADQYALACIVAEMLTGQVLYDGPSAPAVMAKHFGPPPLPETWPEGVPAGVRDVLHKALAQQPGERFADVLALSRALQEVETKDTFQGEPLSSSVQRQVRPGEDLVTVLASLPPDSTVHLQAGVYRLKAPLVLEQAATLLGEGADLTQILWEGEGTLLTYRGLGMLRLQHLTLRKTGPSWGNVLAVEDGLVDLKACRFAGGVWDAKHREGGSGLLFCKGAQGGRVMDCSIEGNGLHGIVVQGEAQPVLWGNRCVKNTRVGIRYVDKAGGEAIENHCKGNGLYGIVVRGEAQPVLRGNRCVQNTQVGIRYADKARGEAVENYCEGNGLHGIVVTGEAWPVLQGNWCAQNTQSGIAYFEHAAGKAVENHCKGNGLHGIVVTGEAQPVLQGNQCVQNTEVGIRYSDRAAGKAAENHCEDNGLHGIVVTDEARPVLQGNRCMKNTQAGIAYFREAIGEAVDNYCEGNGLQGIAVLEQAHPTLKRNRCVNNEER